MSSILPPQPRPRVYDLHTPAPKLCVELHEHDCTCRHCPGYPERPLGWRDMGLIALAAAATGSAIAFAYDAHAAWAALASCFGG